MSNPKSKKIIFLAIFLSVLFFVLLFIFYLKNNGNNFFELKNESLAVDEKPKKPEQITVKGIYLTAYSAFDAKKLDSVIKLINETELNAVIIDIKDYSGRILYDSNLDLVNELKADNEKIGDIKAVVEKLRQNNIYTIARQTVFQDPILANKKPEWALKNKWGGLWRDHKGLSWVDPTVKEVWEYNLEIAKEAISFGFDEVNFDYVRYPSDGVIANASYKRSGLKRAENMKEFFQFLSEGLKDEPAWISLDFFGFVMEHNDDIGIGQRVVDAVDFVDYISPMMYPSHYPSGHLGLANPAAYPGVVIENGMKKGLPLFQGKRAKVRPWLQAFNMGATYDSTRIRSQIDMVEKYSDAGWMLWNASNRYTTAGLKLAD